MVFIIIGEEIADKKVGVGYKRGHRITSDVTHTLVIAKEIPPIWSIVFGIRRVELLGVYPIAKL